MRQWLFAAGVMVALAGCSAGSGKTGAELFATHCAGCHPDGGNTIRPTRTLKAADRHANGLRNARDIAGYIRNPGQGMPAFPVGMIPPDDALKIGEYILSRFK